MKLQIKDSGAWRNMAGIPSDRVTIIMDAAARLLRLLDQPKTVMRVTDGEIAYYYCEGPSFLWRLAAKTGFPQENCRACHGTRRSCTMNCGLSAEDKRTRADMLRDCEDCDTCHSCRFSGEQKAQP